MKTLSLAAGAMLALAGAVQADYATFTTIVNSAEANDITPDGRVIVGNLANGFAYRWTAETGVVVLGGADARAVSDDGTVIFGSKADGMGLQRAAVWTEATGWVLTGDLPGGSACGTVTTAYELSGDGQVGVGLGWTNGCEGTGFRWTNGSGMQALAVLANGTNRASTVTPDGQIVGGFAQGTTNRTPAIWFADGTGMTLDPSGNALGEVYAFSLDGNQTLGSWDGRGFILEDGDMSFFDGTIPAWQAISQGVAEDGTIVGFDILGGARRAWIRPAGTKGLSLVLHTYLTGLGAEGLPASLQVAQAISANGRIIIGHGFPDPAWIARIHPDADLDGDLVVGFNDLVVLLAAWGPCGDPCPADLDGDGQVGFTDLVELLAAWD